MTVPAKTHPPMRQIALADWLRIAEQLFGTDSKLWRFRCVACGHVQSAASIHERAPDLSAERVAAIVHSSCEGRLHPAPEPPVSAKKSRGRKKAPEKLPPLVGCDWTLGGLFKIHDLEVLDPSGRMVPVFPFDHPDADAAISMCLLPPRVYPTTEAKRWADWTWPEWVPAEVRTQIEHFWNEDWHRSPAEWLRDAKRQGGPPLGERVTLKRLCEEATSTGRFVHAWNNIGRLVLDDGSVECVSF